MVNINRQTTSPIEYPRSRRPVGVRGLTSLPAGRVVPLAAHGILREDAILRGEYRVNLEMLETAELLMNATYVSIHAYFVPWLAFSRFNGSQDQLNRSYMGQPLSPGEAVTPFFENVAMGAGGSKAIYKYLGLHAKDATLVNTMYAEAYNEIWNFRARNRSPDIVERARLDYTLAPAFWRHENFSHIVPDFDQAVIDGEVALNVLNAKLPIKGLYGYGAVETTNNTTQWDSEGNVLGTTPRVQVGEGVSARGLSAKTLTNASPISAVNHIDVFAEMEENGITVSLSNIELAKKTQAFARMREQYTELDDEFVLDLLMGGVHVPDQSLKQPMLLAERTTVFGQSKRYSTDADAMATSATNGGAVAEFAIRLPRINTGGVVMVTAEITPEQLFERKKDYFFHVDSVADLPEALRDTLDPEKVEVVPNDYVDVDHATPNGVFGYAPLNHALQGVDYRIGGKFYRPDVDAPIDDERQRLWAVEKANPVLGPDFYLCTTMHTKPFLDTVADPFEAVTIANLMIEGNTVFGGLLVEALNNYDAVMEKAPQDRIDLPE